MNVQCILLLYYIIHIYGFLHSNLNRNIYHITSIIKSTIHDYEYDWTSGEVAWEYDNYDDISEIDDNISGLKYDKINYSTDNIIETEIIDTEIIDTELIEIKSMNTNIIMLTDFENKIIWKAVISGIMKGIYIQIITIDNIITYIQCYTNKVVEFDIIVSILYIIFYKKTKSIERKNILALKNYNNMYLFEKYMRSRRNSSIIVLVLYILFFREISNAE